MAEKYKFIFFHGRGRGEMIRYIFAQANVPYEEHTIKKNPKKWMNEKSTMSRTVVLNINVTIEEMPFGAVPVLEVNGKLLAQSTSIARFLAAKHGLAGNDLWTTAYADMIVQAIEDIYGNYKKFVLATFRNEELAKNEAWKVLRNESLKPLFERLEKLLGNRNYFSGDQLTWADLAVAELSDRMEKCFEKNFMDSYPNLKKHMNRIHELPNIKKYIEKRPAYQL